MRKMCGKTYTWQTDNTSKELQDFLALLSEDYPLSSSGNGKVLRFREIEAGLHVKRIGDGYEIGYSRLCDLGRAFGTVLSGLAENSDLHEHSQMETIGVMLDCCRNAVLTVEQVKKWLRRMVLLGYNWVMLYTKDTYELDGEDFFGYLRGRYTADELMEIDSYAQKLGIRMVGCIQALGHLEPTLRWPAYFEVKDTPSVLLTTELKSYELIGKMLDFYSSAYKSRRIHIGMDETHDLGRGRYMDFNGYRNAYEIYNEHLNKVAGMCRERGLEPMIWSDMFFRLGCISRSYYDPETVIPESVKNNIPQSVQLTYWDYYHDNEEFYCDWIKRHRDLGFEPVMASAIWTWPVFWYDHDQSVKTVTPCVKACLKEHVKEIFFTMWGDDGAYCDWDSAQAGLCHAAELIYNNGMEPDIEKLKKRFRGVCKSDYVTHVDVAGINPPPEKDVVSSGILWDDPLLGIYWKYLRGRGDVSLVELENNYRNISDRFINCEDNAAGSVKHAATIAGVLALKLQAARLLYEVYFSENGGKDYSKVIATAEETLNAIERLKESYRRFWYERYKTFGFEVMQIRLGGLSERFKELITRLQDLVSGRIKSIPELEEHADSAKVNCKYRDVATAAYDF
jgi:hypothetical protein